MTALTPGAGRCRRAAVVTLLASLLLLLCFAPTMPVVPSPAPPRTSTDHAAASATTTAPGVSSGAVATIPMVVAGDDDQPPALPPLTEVPSCPHGDDPCRAVRALVEAMKPPTSGRALAWRMLREDKSGIGSNFRGLVSTFFLALLTRRRLIVQTDCPDLRLFYTSPYVAFEDVAPGTPLAPQRCGVAWLDKGLKTLMTDAQSTATASDAAAVLERLIPGPKGVIMCDRELVHVFLAPIARSVKLGRPYDVLTGLSGVPVDVLRRMTDMPAADVVGCLFRLLLVPRPYVDDLIRRSLLHTAPPLSDVTVAGVHNGTDVVRAALAATSTPDPFQWSKEDLTRQRPCVAARCGGNTGSTVRVGVQIRRGGSTVKWKDPSRVPRKKEAAFFACVGDGVGALTRHPLSEALPRVFASTRLDVSSTATHVASQPSLFVTSDSRGGLVAAVAQVTPEASSRLFLVNPVMPGRTFHTALSPVAGSPGEVGSAWWTSEHFLLDLRTVLDFEMLVCSDYFAITRSSFGEMAAWAGLGKSRQRIVMLRQHCNVTERDEDCSVEWC